jgi:hypothetical protein
MSTPEQVPPAVQNVDTWSSPPPQFEFNRDQEKLIGDLGRKMSFVGMFMMVMSIINLFIMLIARRVDVSVLVFFLIGLWTLTAGRGFQQIAATTGRDITHLMEAIGGLRKMYTLVYWLLVIGLVLALILLVWIAAAGNVQFKVD